MVMIEPGNYERRLPLGKEFLQQLLRNPSVVKMVAVMDIASLSTLELIESGMSKQDVRFAFTNGIIELDPGALSMPPSPAVVDMIANGHYDYWNSRKFRLSGLGLFILETIKREDTFQA